MAFDVASVKRVDPGAPFSPPGFPLDNGDAYRPTGGRFHADFPLWLYVQFAYKLNLTADQRQTLLSHLPKWVAEDRIAVEARVENNRNPTKDQMRLMVQSLLADRFKLAVHFETQEVAVFALTLLKAGKLGPNLHLHADGPACIAPAPEDPPPGRMPVGPNEVFPPICDAYMRVPGPNGVRFRDGSRNTTMALIADHLARGIGRPVVDRTGLTERMDFTLNWTPEPTGAPPADAANPPDSQGPTLLQAVREQLGLKLESTKAPLPILGVDHVEHPSEN